MRRSSSSPSFAFVAFALAAVAFLVQSFPIIGLIGLILAMPLWSTLLVNLGMILLVMEVRIDRLARGWLVLPIVFYGGYAVFTAIGHLEGARLRSEIAAAAEQVRTLPFDAVGRPLVAANRELAHHLISSIDLPEVYWTADRFGEQRRLALRIGDAAACAIARAERTTGTVAVEYELFPRGGQATAAACLYSVPREPDGPTATIEKTSRKIRQALVTADLETTRVTDARGSVATLTAGSLSVPSWFPLFIAACHPAFDAAPAFCGFDLVWNTTFDLAPTLAADTARLLGRMRTGTAEMRPTFADRTDPDLDDLPRKNREAAEATLARVLSNPHLALADRDRDLVATHADPRLLDLETLIPRLEPRLDATTWPEWLTTLTVLDLIAALPADRFAAIAPRFAEVLEQRLAADRVGAHWTVDRLARRGAGTLPVLARLFRSPHPAVKTAALKSLCILGADAAPIADEVAAFLIASGRPGYAGSVADFTLRRMGRSDLTLPPPEPRPGAAEPRPDRRAGIGPQTPASECP